MMLKSTEKVKIQESRELKKYSIKISSVQQVAIVPSMGILPILTKHALRKKAKSGNFRICLYT